MPEQKISDVDLPSIKLLVHTFYDKIRTEKTLGPIFNGVIEGNWDRHLNTMVDFWSSVMLSTGQYKGTPMVKHVALKNVKPEHFDLWLALFRETTTELFTPEIAHEFVLRAERIAESFKIGMFELADQFKVVNAPIKAD